MFLHFQGVEFFFGCPDRCGLVIYKQDMKAGFLPTQPDPNPWGRKIFSPKQGCEILGDVFFGLNREDCKRSITPRNVCQKTNLAPMQQAHFKRIVEAARATDEGSQSLAHFFGKIQTSSLPKIV